VENNRLLAEARENSRRLEELEAELAVTRKGKEQKNLHKLRKEATTAPRAGRAVPAVSRASG